MIGKDYVFSTVEDRYAVCGKIFNSVENAKNSLKMKHVKRYVIIYRIFANPSLFPNLRKHIPCFSGHFLFLI